MCLESFVAGVVVVVLGVTHAPNIKQLERPTNRFDLGFSGLK